MIAEQRIEDSVPGGALSIGPGEVGTMRVSLPVMTCEPNCGECCTIAPCKPHEFQAIKDFAKARGIEPKDNGLTCPWYQNGGCTVYEVRPFVCRMMGHVPKLECHRGHNVNIAPLLERRLTKEYGKPTMHTHDIIPGALEKALRNALNKMSERRDQLLR